MLKFKSSDSAIWCKRPRIMTVSHLPHISTRSYETHISNDLLTLHDAFIYVYIIYKYLFYNASSNMFYIVLFKIDWFILFLL